MKLVVAYLVLFLVVLGVLLSFDLRNLLPAWMGPYSFLYRCSLIGGLGGVVYCLRAVYLNRSVQNNWKPEWEIWYFLRPIVSCLAGIVAYIFLEAGLLILDAQEGEVTSPYGFLALSFIAGLNVDGFINRIEDIAQSAWGIRPSRTSEKSKGRDNKTDKPLKNQES